MISNTRHYHPLLCQIVLSLPVLAWWNLGFQAVGQELPTKIENELTFTLAPFEAGKLYLFMASTKEYIVDVAFLCTYGSKLDVFDPFGEDIHHPAWRTAVFQKGQLVGYLQRPISDREFNRRPTKLKHGFVVGAACEIKTGPQTLLDPTESGPIVRVLGYGTYELQTTLLQNFLVERGRENPTVIARSAVLTVEVTKSPRVSDVAVNPEGRAEMHIADYIPGPVKNDLFFYYVNTTGKTREIYNPFVQLDYGPNVAVAVGDPPGAGMGYLELGITRDFGMGPSLWLEIPFQGIVGRVPYIRHLASGSRVQIVYGKRFFAENFFKTMEIKEAGAQIYKMENVSALESPYAVAP